MRYCTKNLPDRKGRGDFLRPLHPLPGWRGRGRDGGENGGGRRGTEGERSRFSRKSAGKGNGILFVDRRIVQPASLDIGRGRGENGGGKRSRFSRYNSDEARNDRHRRSFGKTRAEGTNHSKFSGSFSAGKGNGVLFAGRHILQPASIASRGKGRCRRQTHSLSVLIARGYVSPGNKNG